MKTLPLLPKKSTKEDRYITLGWEILEHKWRYYIGTGYGIKTIPDEDFDKIEAEYILLCSELQKKEYSNTVGFPHHRNSAKLVDKKMKHLYGIKESPFWK